MYESEKLARDWIKAWQTGDLSLLKLAPDFSHASPFGLIEGRENYLELIIPASKKNVAEIELLELISDESRVVLRFVTRGPHGETPTSEWIYTQDGVIKSIISYYDKGTQTLA